MMISNAPLSPGLDVVTVEELHYGKLVISRHGHVPAGEGYATTYRTAGFMHADRVLPTKLLDGVHLQQDDIEDAFDTCGALFFRIVDKTLVVMRVRYRAESGEGRPGRKYLQACIRQIMAPRGFADVPPAFIPWTGDMQAEPDLEKRLDARAIATEFAHPSRLTREVLDSWQPARRNRIAGIVHAMRTGERFVIGRDLFDSPDQPVEGLVGEFLSEVELALTLTGQGEQPVSRNFRIACGLSADIGGANLILTSTERSTAPSEARWRDLVAIVRPEPPPRHQPSVLPERRPDLTRLPLARRAGLIEPAWSTMRGSGGPSSANSAPGSLGSVSESASSGRPPLMYPPLRDRAMRTEAALSAAYLAHSSNRSDSPGRGRAAGRSITPDRQSITIDVVLSRFGYKYQEAANGSRRLATFQLFDIAADLRTREILEGWNPFDEGSPSKSAVCLGLLLGLYVPRNDILDWFTLTELLCVFAYVELMPLSPGRSDWAERLVSCIDARISRVGALTHHEFCCVKNYVCAEFADNLSLNSWSILSKEGRYFDTPSSSIFPPDCEAHATAKDALERMVNRCEKRFNEMLVHKLILDTSQDPDMFNLLPRQSTADKSKNLLTRELDRRRHAVLHFAKDQAPDSIRSTTERSRPG